MLEGKRILLIIGGGIAAFKALDLIRRMREAATRARMASARGAPPFFDRGPGFETLSGRPAAEVDDV